MTSSKVPNGSALHPPAHNFVVWGFVAAAAACAAPGGPDHRHDPGATQAPLRGEADGAQCTPFMLTHIDRAQDIASALLHNEAFTDCVEDRISESYMDCGDGAPGVDVLEEVATALRAGNHIRLNCIQRVGGPCGTGGTCPAGQICRDGYCGINQDSAAVGSWNLQDEVLFNVGSHWTNEHWHTAIQPQQATNPAYPWNAAADTLLHEFSHTHAYLHEENATLQAECANSNGRGSYYENGEPSIPYIVSECAANAVSAVYDMGLDLHTTLCPVDSLALPATYDPSMNDPLEYDSVRAGFEGFVCERINRRRIWIRTGNGHFFSASSGGGAELTAKSTGGGDWERLYVHDWDGGALDSGDLVSLRVHNTPTGPQFVRVSSTSGGELTADGTDPNEIRALFTIYRASGSGPIETGTPIRLYSWARNRYVTAVGNGGGALVSDAWNPSTWETFTIEEPRRAFLVSFRTAAENRAIAFEPSGGINDLQLVTPAPVGSPQERNEYFWVFDHGRGLLEDTASGLNDGDIITLRTDRYDEYWSWSTCGSGTGKVSGRGFYMNQCNRFRLDREAGPGRIRDGDVVYLSSLSHGNWLTAVPSSYSDPALRNRVVNNRTTAPPTSNELNWERFTVHFAQNSAFDLR